MKKMFILLTLAGFAACTTSSGPAPIPKAVCQSIEICNDLDYGACQPEYAEFGLRWLQIRYIPSKDAIAICPDLPDLQPVKESGLKVSIDTTDSRWIIIVEGQEAAFQTWKDSGFCMDEYTGGYDISESGDGLRIVIMHPAQCVEYMEQHDGSLLFTVQFVCPIC